MCILLCTLKHPDYALVLGSNRDEFFERPTARASFVTDNILMPIDLAREEHGTWIGITKNGRFCVLVNYREDVSLCQIGVISRGMITKDFLQSNLDPLEWAHDIKKRSNNFNGIGGFSLFFGNIGGQLYVLSNRSEKILKVDNNDIFGISNSAVDDPWMKVIHGKELFQSKVMSTKTLESTINTVFEVMGDSCLTSGGSLSEALAGNIKESIFVPDLINDISCEQTMGRTYGTRTQTVIVVSHNGYVSYVEKDVSTGNIQTYEFCIVK